MVEVFKTDVSDKHSATNVVNVLHSKYQRYKANFDLEDCDKILRVESKNGALKVEELLLFLRVMGINAEVLPD